MNQAVFDRLKGQSEQEQMNISQPEELPELPQEFLEKMKGILGEQWGAFRRSYEQPPKQGLRVNTLKGSSDRLLSYGLFGLRPVPWAADGFYYEPGERPGRHPFHEAGVYYIQEPSAMAVAGLLKARPKERVLDLCAAPGGKTTQLAAAMKGEGLLISNEIHSGRAKILSQNVERLGLRNCLVTNETPEAMSLRFPGFFHRILVDAPCSGEGMFRKDPQSRIRWSMDNVRMCAGRQKEILDCAARMLMPGGRLVYSTCAFSPEEDEENVRWFLFTHPEFEEKDSLRIWPHLSEGEGHFAAVFEKAGEEKADFAGSVRLQTGIPEKKLPKEYLAFAEQTLQTEEKFPSRYLAFGEHLYLFPDQMPDIAGLKIFRPGLELGEVKKNRFEPAHALALALKPKEAFRCIRLSLDGQEVLRYLHGETISGQTVQGWCLVCVEGYSLGWGKAANGQLKNHYPKGLRWN